MNDDTQLSGLNVRVDAGSRAIAAPPTDGYSYLKNIFVFRGVNYMKFFVVYQENRMLGRSYLKVLLYIYNYYYYLNYLMEVSNHGAIYI